MDKLLSRETAPTSDQPIGGRASDALSVPTDGGRAQVVAYLSERRVVWSSSTLGASRRIFYGYAAADVENVRLLGKTSESSVEMTQPWTPSSAVKPLRLLIAVDETDSEVGQDGLQPEEFSLVEEDFPPIQVEYQDGRVVKPGSD